MTIPLPDPTAVPLDPFWHSLDLIEKFEGGYAHDPLDHGGNTNYGITQRTYDVWCKQNGEEPQPVARIDDSDVTAIYWQNYWVAGGCQALASPLNFAHFDAVVNMAPHWWKQCLAVASGDWQAYCAKRLWCYQQIVANDPSQVHFLPGWRSRVARVQAICSVA